MVLFASRGFLATDPVVAIFFNSLLTPARDQFFIGNSVMSLLRHTPSSLSTP